MFDYLQKFNNLPKNLRDQVSSPAAMLILTELENKYKLDLAMVVMKVMIKNITLNNLPSYFISEAGLTREAGAELTKELKERIFIGVADYLGITSDIRALDLEKDIKIIIAEAGLTLSSLELINRFKSILATYLRGIRAKIDTRAVLGKEVISGGLNLSPAEIDRVFKVCDTQKFKSLNISINSSPINSTLSNRPVIVPSSQLNKIISSEQGKISSAGKMADYNLKEMIARGQLSKPQLDLPNVKPQLDLPKAKKQLDLPKSENVLKLEKELKINEAVQISTPMQAQVKAPVSAPVQAQVKAPVNTQIQTQVKASINTPAPFVPPVVKEQIITRPVSTPAQIKIQTPVQAPSTQRPITPIIQPRPVQARQNMEIDLVHPAHPTHPTMHDVKAMPKVMGPIEELQFLDVLNFRRLGTTAPEAVIKIFNKIKQLEREGYDKMILGIKAWRQSPVNRLYVKIGQEAISKGMTIREAALNYQKSNPEYLKIEEIEAIVSLNSKLVF